MYDLYPHQQAAVEKMKNGCLLVGGVGTGKSRTSLAYYVKNEANRPLYIITTARKRDTLDWQQEAEPFQLSCHVDSWNNIRKYVQADHALFIFDAQRVVGYGAWVRSFLKIVKKNRWILLTSTPGDTWSDYIPVFIANGFYRNKTDFANQHIVYSRYSKYSKVDHYLNEGRLIRQRNDILVPMRFEKKTVPHDQIVWVPFNAQQMKDVAKSRWDIYKNQPIRDAAGLCYILRRIANGDERRIDAVRTILEQRKRAIVFYNFDYELELLKNLCAGMDICYAEWNGHKHEPVPHDQRWAYLVQYTAGAEGWNCIETDTIIFYSQNYSYKMMAQAAGRIDRLNTPYTDLYYYHLLSRSGIDLAIRRAIHEKRDFNEKMFVRTA